MAPLFLLSALFCFAVREEGNWICFTFSWNQSNLSLSLTQRSNNIHKQSFLSLSCWNTVLIVFHVWINLSSHQPMLVWGLGTTNPWSMQTKALRITYPRLHKPGDTGSWTNPCLSIVPHTLPLKNTSFHWKALLPTHGTDLHSPHQNICKNNNQYGNKQPIKMCLETVLWQWWTLYFLAIEAVKNVPRVYGTVALWADTQKASPAAT